MATYTKQDYERDLKIIADAPCNSTHFVKRVNRVLYYKLHRSILYSWDKINSDWVYISYMGRASNSLQDIHDKIAMYKATQELISENKKHNPHLVYTSSRLILVDWATGCTLLFVASFSSSTFMCCEIFIIMLYVCAWLLCIVFIIRSIRASNLA